MNELFGTSPAQTLTRNASSVSLFDALTAKYDKQPADKSGVFSGISHERVERREDTLVFSFDFRRPIAEQTDVYIYCFG